jgi:uroporphyrinogen-III synthase
VEVVPARHDAEGLLEALGARPLAGARVLYVAAADAREVLPDGLQRRGALVTVIPAYRTVPDVEGAAQLRALLPGGIDLVTLAAPSAVRAYSAAAGAHAGVLPVATIGPVTTEAARAAGLPVVAEARDAAARGLAEAVAAWARRR